MTHPELPPPKPPTPDDIKGLLEAIQKESLGQIIVELIDVIIVSRTQQVLGEYILEEGGLPKELELEIEEESRKASEDIANIKKNLRGLLNMGFGGGGQETAAKILSDPEALRRIVFESTPDKEE